MFKFLPCQTNQEMEEQLCMADYMDLHATYIDKNKQQQKNKEKKRRKKRHPL